MKKQVFRLIKLKWKQKSLELINVFIESKQANLRLWPGKPMRVKSSEYCNMMF